MLFLYTVPDSPSSEPKAAGCCMTVKRTVRVRELGVCGCVLERIFMKKPQVLILMVTNEWEILRGSIPGQLRSTLPVTTGKAQYALHVSRAILSSVSKNEYDLNKNAMCVLAQAQFGILCCRAGLIVLNKSSIHPMLPHAHGRDVPASVRAHGGTSISARMWSYQRSAGSLYERYLWI